MMRGERIRRPYAVFVRRRRRGGTPAEADDETAEIPVAADDGPAAAEEGCGPGFGLTPDARVGECGTGLLLSGAEGTEGTTESEGRR